MTIKRLEFRRITADLILYFRFFHTLIDTDPQRNFLILQKQLQLTRGQHLNIHAYKIPHA